MGREGKRRGQEGGGSTLCVRREEGLRGTVRGAERCVVWLLAGLTRSGFTALCPMSAASCESLGAAFTCPVPALRGLGGRGGEQSRCDAWRESVTPPLPPTRPHKPFPPTHTPPTDQRSAARSGRPAPRRRERCHRRPLGGRVDGHKHDAGCVGEVACQGRNVTDRHSPTHQTNSNHETCEASTSLSRTRESLTRRSAAGAATSVSL